MGVAPLSFEAPFSNRQSLISGSNAGFSEDPEYPSPICLEFPALLCTWYEETLEFPKRSPIPNGRFLAGRRSRRSEEHTSELQSLMRISYAVFCLKKKSTNIQLNTRQFK